MAILTNIKNKTLSNSIVKPKGDKVILNENINNTNADIVLSKIKNLDISSLYDPTISSNTVIENIGNIIQVQQVQYLVVSNYLSEYKAEQDKQKVRNNLDIYSTQEVIENINEAISNLTGDASEDYNTLKKIEERIKEIPKNVDIFNADNVLFTSDLTITSPVGVHTIPSSGYKTLETTGKSVKQVMDLLFSESKNPQITLPYISSININNTSLEVGSYYTPNYSCVFNKGKYEFGPDTNVQALSWSIQDTNNNKATTQNGQFPQFQLADNTNYNIRATVHYSNGSIPKTNLGQDYPEGQILEGDTIVKTSSSMSSYRKYFYGYLTEEVTDINSTVVRGLQNHSNKAYTAGTFTITIPVGTKQILIACVSAVKGVTRIFNKNITQDVTETFIKHQNIRVEGANNYREISYNVWSFTTQIPYQNQTTLEITFG